MHLFGRLASINGRAWGEWHSKRSVQATWIGGSIPENCAYQNTAERTHLTAIGLELQRADKVVSLEAEFPAKTHPGMKLQERCGAGLGSKTEGQARHLVTV
jgi:selenocysteine lyase/cysteine desulfurase